MRYFHDTCKPLLEKLNQSDRIDVEANIDIQSAEHFYTALCAFKKTRLQDTIEAIRKELLKGVAPCIKPDQGLCCSPENMPAADLAAGGWIKFPALGEAPAVAGDVWPTGGVRRASAVAGGDEAVSASIIKFDEQTGKQLTSEKVYATEVAKAKPVVPYKVPWKLWLEQNRELGVAEAEKACAVAALNAVHEKMDIAEARVAIILEERSHYVVAEEDILPGKLVLWPCIPRTAKVFDQSPHALAVKVIAMVMAPVGECAPNRLV